MKGPCRALFWQGSPEISLIWGSIWGTMEVREGPLSLGRVGQWPFKWSNMVRGARECQKSKFPKFSQNSWIFLIKHYVYVRGPVGSIEGPRLVLNQSPENIQIFLGTTITFQKLPTFLAVNFSYYGLFQAERVVNIVPEIAFLASVYQIFGKIIPNVAFHKINIISSF